MWCLHTAKLVSPHFKQLQCLQKMLAVSLRASFHMHGCRDDQVWKDGLGSISITASFRGNLPSPGEDSLVLFTMATCVYRNASDHAIHWIRQRNSYSFGPGFLFWCELKRNLIVFDDQMIDVSKDKRIVNLFTRGSHHRNLSVIYIVQNLFHQGKGGRSIGINSHYLVLFKNPRDKLQILTLAKQMYPGRRISF